MGYSALATLVVGAASYDQQQGANNRAADAAEAARLDASFQAQANRQAAEQAVTRENLAEQAAKAQEDAVSQMAEKPEVTVADEGLSASARRRRVQAQFNMEGPASGGAGSIRV